MPLVDPIVQFVVVQEPSAVVVVSRAQQRIPVWRVNSSSAILLDKGLLRMKYLRQPPTTLRCSPASRAQTRVAIRTSREARLAQPQT